MKKLAAFLMVLVLLLTALAAAAEDGAPDGDDPIVILINDHDITKSELKSAATLYMFEAALSCAGYGYGFDMTDPLNIEDEMDKLVFELERWYVTQDLAEEMGLYPLSDEAYAAAVKDAEETWEKYRAIAWSDNGMAFLPAGNYQYREDDPEGNITRYFASFGLTKEALLQKAIWEQAHDELGGVITASMTNNSPDEILNYYSTWFLGQMDMQYIDTDDELIARVMAELGEDPTENQGGDGYESYERSILISDIYYTLGESTVRDFERNGWTWTQDADGRFAFRVTEDDNYFYVRTDNSQPDGKLVMVDMFYAYDIAYEYLGYGFDRSFDPEKETTFDDYLVEIYGAEYNDEGVLQARTEVVGGTLLIESGELTLRLTLE